MKKTTAYLCTILALISLFTGCSSKDMQNDIPDNTPETQVPETQVPETQKPEIDPPRKDETMPSVTESDMLKPDDMKDTEKTPKSDSYNENKSKTRRVK